MKRNPSQTLFMVLGVILVFSLTSCATLQNRVTTEQNTLTLHFADGDVITYTLPPEFPALDENQLEYVPIYYGYAVVVRQVIGDNIYGIILAGPDAIIVGAGMFIGDEDTWWIYENGKAIDKSNDHAALDAWIEKCINELVTNSKTET